MDQTTLKILPGYKDLARQVEKQSIEITVLTKQWEQTNQLLASLNKYHGEPESPKGYLEQILDVTRCDKNLTIKHRSRGSWVTILMVGFALTALIVEVASKGEFPFFSVAWPYIKGVFI